MVKGGCEKPEVRASHELPAQTLFIAARQFHAELTYRALEEVLSTRGIDHILLKGPHLGAVAYDNSWERPYCDLDVLIRPDRFLDAVTALVDAGFRRCESPADRSATIESFYNWALVSPSGWAVELHRELAGYRQFCIVTDALFNRAVDFRFGETAARGLALEDLLMHLVIHAAKGHFRNIEAKHITDVASLVARQPVNWEIYIQRAREARCVTASWVMFQAAKQIHAAAIPDQVLAELRPSLFRRAWLASWLTTREFPLFRWERWPVWLGRVLMMPALIDRFRDAMACVIRYAKLRFMDLVGRIGSARS